MKILLFITLLIASVFSRDCFSEVVQLNKLSFKIFGCGGMGCSSSCAICLPKVQRFVSSECAPMYDAIIEL